MKQFASFTALLSVLILMPTPSVSAQWLSWETRTELNFDGILSAGSEMVRRGFAPVKIESTFEDGDVRYSGIWMKEADIIKDGRELVIRMNEQTFNEEVNSRKAKGHMPVDIAVTTVAGEPQFSAIFSKQPFDKWRSWHGLSAAVVSARTDEYKVLGMQLVDVNAYPTPTGMQFAAIWGDAGFDATINAIAVSESQFKREISKLPNGFVPLSINVGSIANETVYSGIFVKDETQSHKAAYDLNESELRTFFADQVNAGYVPFTLTTYNLKLKRKHAAVFWKPRPVEVKSAPVFAAPTVSFPTSSRRVLDIEPVLQQTKVWCWLAIGEMVFRHYGVPARNPASFQCGIIGTLMSDTECYSNCFNARCIRPSGSNYATVRMLKDYAWLSSRRVLNANESYELPFAAIKANIDSAKPIIAGVSPIRKQYHGGAEHVALIVGYEAGVSGVDLIVNDPFPYPPMGNPYIRAGARALNDYQYRIPLRDFTQGLFWHWSIHNITLN
jgi:hypothetical protein